MIEISKITLFLLKVISSEFCCFDKWTSWQQDSLTCGRICRHRKRPIILGICGPMYGDCNYDHSDCPSFESQEASCNNIPCREFNFKIVSLYSFLE